MTLADGGVPSYNRRNVYFAAATVYSLFVGAGIVMAWASPSVPKLKEEGHNFTDSQYSLLASITGLAPGPLVSMFGVNNIGRKWSLFVVWAGTVISPLMMLFSRDVYVLLVARVIGGFGMSAAFSVIGLYVAEISDAEVRGLLNSAGLIFILVGSVITASVAPFVTFLQFAEVSLAVSSVFGVLWPFLPESPYYLLAKNRTKEARSVLNRLRLDTSTDLIEKELSSIELSIQEERRFKNGFRKLFTSKAVFKQMAISFYLLYIQQGSGLSPLGSYQQEIFDSAHLPFKGEYVPIGMAVVSLFIMIPGPFFLNKFGSKPMFMYGGFGSGLFLSLLGIYFICLNAGYSVSSVSWISIVLYLLVNQCIYIGLGGNVWGMVSELFAPSVKGYATGICGIFSTFIGFVMIEVFGRLKTNYGLGQILLGFGLVQFFASIGLFFLTDTTKMTLQEIQDHFEGRTHSTKK